MAHSKEASCLKLIKDVLLPACEKLQRTARPPLSQEYTQLLSMHKVPDLDALPGLAARIETEAAREKQPRKDFADLARAWFIVKAGHAINSFGRGMAIKFIMILKKLAERSDFDPHESQKILLAQVSMAAVNCKKLRELLEWMKLVKDQQSSFPELAKSVIRVIHIRLEAVVWKKMTGGGFGGMFDVLRGLWEQMAQIFGSGNLAAKPDLNAVLGRLSTQIQPGGGNLREVIGSLQDMVFAPEDASSSLGIVRFDGGLNEIIDPVLTDEQLQRISVVHSWDQLQKHSSSYDYSRHRGEIRISVLRAKLKQLNEEVAVKVYQSPHEEQLNLYLEEVKILNKLSEARLDVFLKFYGAFYDQITEDGTRLYRLNIVMEFCPENLLQSTLKEALPYQAFERLMEKLLKGFSYLQEQGIFHQDVKPSNILINSNKDFKIADFNVSKIAVEDQALSASMHRIEGTQAYFSPELNAAWLKYNRGEGGIEFEYCPVKSDVYSLGLTLLQAVTGESMANKNDEESIEELQQTINNVCGHKDEHRVLLTKMLAFDEMSRPDFKTLYAGLQDYTN